MKVLRTKEVVGLTGISRVTLWRWEKAGHFPARLRLGANSVGWLEDEVRGWLNRRPRGMVDGHAPRR